MLVIGREEEESVRIEGPATITVLRIRGRQVRLGIVADSAETRIIRTELEREARDGDGK